MPFVQQGVAPLPYLALLLMLRGHQAGLLFNLMGQIGDLGGQFFFGNIAQEVQHLVAPFSGSGQNFFVGLLQSGFMVPSRPPLRESLSEFIR